MTNWAALRHAYGPADDIPGLLAAAEADPNDETVWTALWGHLCHQGTIYSASYPALSALATMAARHPSSHPRHPLHLAAGIVASEDRPEDMDAIRRDYPDELQTLRDLAEQSLRPSDDFVTFLYGLQALMAFEGSPPWNRELEALASEEVTLECPSCDEYLTITIAEAPATTTAMDDALPITTVTPADPHQLRGSTARIYSLALQHEQAKVLDRLPYLFGDTLCPACGTTLNLPQALST